LLWTNVGVKLVLVGLLLFGTFSGLERFEGKAFAGRALAYPISALIVPIAWWLVARRRFGFGAITAVLWEFAEYVTFIRNSPALATAYEDTLGDLGLGLTGATVAAAITAFALYGRRSL
jgi:hypothetical protein